MDITTEARDKIFEHAFTTSKEIALGIAEENSNPDECVLAMHYTAMHLATTYLAALTLSSGSRSQAYSMLDALYEELRDRIPKMETENNEWPHPKNPGRLH